MDILITMAYTALMTFIMVKVTEKVPSSKKKQTLYNSGNTGGGNGGSDLPPLPRMIAYDRGAEAGRL